MPVSGVFTSCATPAASTPSDARRSFSCSAVSMRHALGDVLQDEDALALVLLVLELGDARLDDATATVSVATAELPHARAGLRQRAERQELAEVADRSARRAAVRRAPRRRGWRSTTRSSASSSAIPAGEDSRIPWLCRCRATTRSSWRCTWSRSCAFSIASAAWSSRRADELDVVAVERLPIAPEAWSARARCGRRAPGAGRRSGSRRRRAAAPRSPARRGGDSGARVSKRPSQRRGRQRGAGHRVGQVTLRTHRQQARSLGEEEVGALEIETVLELGQQSLAEPVEVALLQQLLADARRARDDGRKRRRTASARARRGCRGASARARPAMARPPKKVSRSRARSMPSGTARRQRELEEREAADAEQQRERRTRRRCAP